MRQTIAKKIRRQMRVEERKQILMFSKILRPKPWWVPEAVWFRILKIVITGLGKEDVPAETK